MVLKDLLRHIILNYSTYHLSVQLSREIKKPSKLSGRREVGII